MMISSRHSLLSARFHQLQGFFFKRYFCSLPSCQSNCAKWCVSVFLCLFLLVTVFVSVNRLSSLQYYIILSLTHSLPLFSSFSLSLRLSFLATFSCNFIPSISIKPFSIVCNFHSPPRYLSLSLSFSLCLFGIHSLFLATFNYFQLLSFNPCSMVYSSHSPLSISLPLSYLFRLSASLSLSLSVLSFLQTSYLTTIPYRLHRMHSFIFATVS